MATLTIKNLPDDLYQRLKVRAKHNRRSINSEAIVCLERTLVPHPYDEPEALFAAIDQRHRKIRVRFNADDIAKALDEGRP